MLQMGPMQAGGIFRCPSGLSCNGYFLAPTGMPHRVCTATDCLVSKGLVFVVRLPRVCLVKQIWFLALMLAVASYNLEAFLKQFRRDWQK